MLLQRRFAVVAGALALAACSQAKPEHRELKAERAESAETEKNEHEVELKAADVASEQKVALADAIAAAHRATPGEVIEAGIEGEVVRGKRDVFVEVMVLSASGDAIEVKVDPATGKVLSSAKENEADEAEEVAATAKSLPAGHIGLGDLVRHSRAAAEGQVIAAGFKAKDGGGAIAVVQFLVGKELRQSTLDVKSGAVLATKKVEQDEDEDEDDEMDEKNEGAGKK